MPGPGGAKHKSGSQKRKQKKEEADKIAKLPKLDSFLGRQPAVTGTAAGPSDRDPSAAAADAPAAMPAAAPRPPAPPLAPVTCPAAPAIPCASLSAVGLLPPVQEEVEHEPPTSR